MELDLKNIHIGECIRERADEQKIPIVRICNFFKITEDEINKMYNEKSLETEIILKWSKLLEYDFFRLYTQHLILFSPPGKGSSKITVTSLPQFRKNVYTKEIIDFMLELISTGEKTKFQVIDEYKIPKTTLYKWISKYG